MAIKVINIGVSLDFVDEIVTVENSDLLAVAKTSDVASLSTNAVLKRVSLADMLRETLTPSMIAGVAERDQHPHEDIGIIDIKFTHIDSDFVAHYDVMIDID